MLPLERDMGNRSRLPVIQFTVEKDKKHKRFMGSSFEDSDLKELIQELRSISKMLQSLHSSLGKP